VLTSTNLDNKSVNKSLFILLLFINSTNSTNSSSSNNNVAITLTNSNNCNNSNKARARLCAYRNFLHQHHKIWADSATKGLDAPMAKQRYIGSE